MYSEMLARGEQLESIYTKDMSTGCVICKSSYGGLRHYDTVSCDGEFVCKRFSVPCNNYGGTILESRYSTNFDVLLTVHLSIISVINQLDTQNLVL